MGSCAATNTVSNHNNPDKRAVKTGGSRGRCKVNANDNIGILNTSWGSGWNTPAAGRGGFITRPGDNGKIIWVTETSYRHILTPEPGRPRNQGGLETRPYNALEPGREHPHRLRIPTISAHGELVEPPVRGNRIINPSFRRKPESRTFCIWPTLFRGFPGFRLSPERRLFGLLYLRCDCLVSESLSVCHCKAGRVKYAPIGTKSIG